MVKVLVVLIVSFMSQFAFASVANTILVCSELKDNSLKKDGLIAKIKTVANKKSTVSNRKIQFATVSNNENELAMFDGVKRINPPKGSVGGAVTYKSSGKSPDFILVVNFTTTPILGGHYAHLVAEIDGQRVAATMSCVKTIK